MNKTDEQIHAEAKEALQQALSECDSLVTHKLVSLIKPRLRRAMPFGPNASHREKKLWNLALEDAVKNLGTWAKSLIVVLLIFCFVATPAVALDSDNSQQEVQIVDTHGEPFAVVSPSVERQPVKKLWSERHPKLHKAARTFRKFCIKADPVVRFAGSIAQVFMALTGE